MKKFFQDRIFPHVIPLSVLLAVTIAVYLRTLGHDFQLFWDDEKYVVTNETVKGLTPENVIHAFTTYIMGNYAPVHLISYMLDYHAWGTKAAGFILTNIVFHVCNGILFYALLIRLGWNRLGSFFAAFVFLLHPVQVETVAWVSERKNLLAMFFYLSAFACYLSYQNKGWGKGNGAYVFSFLFFVAALLSKPIAVIFPLMLFLYDICYREKSERSRWQVDKIPFLCAAAVIAWVTIQSQSPGDLPGGGGRTVYHGGSPFATFLTMLTVLTRYLQLLFWPTGLSALYDPPIKTGFDAAVMGGGIILILLAAGGVVLFRRNRRLFFWYGLFFIALLPVSQIVPIVTLMNDRYLYFPMLGAAACFGALLATPVAAISGGRRFIALAAVGLIMLSLSYLSFERAGVWKNELTLWRDTAQKAPNHLVALYGLAQALQNSGDLDSALPVYLRVLELNPRHLDTLTHLGALYRSKNLPLEGRPHLLDITRFYPAYAKGFVDLGKNYYLTDDLVEAEKAFRRAQALQPRSTEALRYLGMIALKTKRVDAARNYFLEVVSLGGTGADVEYNLACVEALSGNSGQALKHLEAAFRLGFRDRNSIENDRDLNAIRHLPGFLLLVRSHWSEKGFESGEGR